MSKKPKQKDKKWEEIDSFVEDVAMLLLSQVQLEKRSDKVKKIKKEKDGAPN